MSASEQSRADLARVKELQASLGDPETTRELYEIATRASDRLGDHIRDMRARWASAAPDTPR